MSSLSSGCIYTSPSSCPTARQSELSVPLVEKSVSKRPSIWRHWSLHTKFSSGASAAICSSRPLCSGEDGVKLSTLASSSSRSNAGTGYGCPSICIVDDVALNRMPLSNCGKRHSEARAPRCRFRKSLILASLSRSVGVSLSRLRPNPHPSVSYPMAVSSVGATSNVEPGLFTSPGGK